MTKFSKLTQPAMASEVKALGNLGTFDSIRSALQLLASEYGEITSVSVLPNMPEADEDEEVGFLVCFERTQDAMAASRSWHCFQFGFTSVVVPLRVQRPF